RARGIAAQGADPPDEALLGQVLGVVRLAGRPVGQAIDTGRVGADDIVPAGRRPLRGRSGLRASVVHPDLPRLVPNCCQNHRARDSPVMPLTRPRSRGPGARIPSARWEGSLPAELPNGPAGRIGSRGSQRALSRVCGPFSARGGIIATVHAALGYVDGYLPEDEPLLAARANAEELGGSEPIR